MSRRSGSRGREPIMYASYRSDRVAFSVPMMEDKYGTKHPKHHQGRKSTTAVATRTTTTGAAGDPQRLRDGYSSYRRDTGYDFGRRHGLVNREDQLVATRLFLRREASERYDLEAHQRDRRRALVEMHYRDWDLIKKPHERARTQWEALAEEEEVAEVEYVTQMKGLEAFEDFINESSSSEDTNEWPRSHHHRSAPVSSKHHHRSTPDSAHSRQHHHHHHHHDSQHSHRHHTSHHSNRRGEPPPPSPTRGLIRKVSLPAIVEGDVVVPSITFREPLSTRHPERHLKYKWSWVLPDGEEYCGGRSSLQVTKDDIGLVLKLRITSKEGDDWRIASDPVTIAEPSVRNLELVGEPTDGNTLELQYEYIGGEEGRTKVEWRRGEDILRHLEGDRFYAITFQDFGEVVIAIVTPRRSDGVWGKTQTVYTKTIHPPNALEAGIFIRGDLRVDNQIVVDVPAVYWSEYPECLIRWYRVAWGGKDGEPLDSITEDQPFVHLVEDDYAHHIRVVFIPVRKDGSQAKSVEYTTEDVVNSAQGVAPVRVEADDVTQDSEVPIAIPPDVRVQLVPSENVTVGQEIRCVVTVLNTDRNAEPGDPLVRWFRGEATLLAEGVLYYKPKEADVDSAIRVEYTPVSRWDESVTGPPDLQYTDSVLPSKPTVSDLTIVGTFETQHNVDVVYAFKGEEGPSLIKWYRFTADRWTTAIPNTANCSTIPLTSDEVGCRLEVRVTPFNSEGVSGDPVSYLSTDTVRRGPPDILQYTLRGGDRIVEGEDLEVEVDVEYFGGTAGRASVWWYRNDEPIPEARGVSRYRTNVEDVGAHIRVRYTPVNGEGIEGREIEMLSSKVQAAEPQVIRGRLEECWCGSSIECVYTYMGGEEGPTKLLWERSVDGITFDQISFTTRRIDFEDYNLYHSTADDLNHTLRCQIMPVRLSDRAEGKAFTTAEARCCMRKEMQAVLQENLRAIKGFNVFDKTAGARKNLLFTARHLRLLKPLGEEEGKKKHKAAPNQKFQSKVDPRTREKTVAWSEHLEIEIERENPTDFRLNFDARKSGETVLFSVRKADQRDMLVLTFRLFQGMGMEEVAKETLGLEVAKDWSKQRIHIDAKKAKDSREQKLKAIADGEEGAEDLPEFEGLSQTRLNDALQNRAFLSMVDGSTINKEIERKGMAFFMARETLRCLLMGADSLGTTL